MIESRDRSAETTPAGVPWGEFRSRRSAVRERWPHHWTLPMTDDILAAPSARGAPHRVLDVGATQRVWEPRVASRWPRSAYRSLDIDRTHRHDYHDFSEIEEPFDLVLLIEVLEHLTPADGLALLADCHRACAPGGLLLATVPNILTPGLQLEFTHQTPYGYLDLGAAVSWAGFEVMDLRRAWLAPRGRRLAVHRTLLYPLHRALAVDFCHSIAILGLRAED